MKRFHVHLHVDDLAKSIAAAAAPAPAPAAEPAQAACCTPRGKPIGIPVKSSSGSCC